MEERVSEWGSRTAGRKDGRPEKETTRGKTARFVFGREKETDQSKRGGSVTHKRKDRIGTLIMMMMMIVVIIVGITPVMMVSVAGLSSWRGKSQGNDR